MAYRLDIESLSTLIRSKRGSKGLREAAKEIGNVSTSTLSRVENGKMPDMETFLALCTWLEVPPANLIKSDQDTAEPEVKPLNASEALAIQLRADKNLDPATANALAELVKAAYANFPKRKQDSSEEK